MFSKRFDVPTFITNDANAAAIGEMHFGCAKTFRNFIVVTLGTGIGCGAVIDGHLLHGRDGLAGEIGHIAAVRNGRNCNCGRRGCLETYASASGVRRTVFQLLAESTLDSELRDIAFNKLNTKMIFQLAQKGDKIAAQAFQIAGEKLGRTLADVAAHYSPEAIIISGGLANAGGLILEALREHFEKNLLRIYHDKIQILCSQMPDGEAALIGAAALAHNESEKQSTGKGNGK